MVMQSIMSENILVFGRELGSYLFWYLCILMHHH
jgi:hypothetical protein